MNKTETNNTSKIFLDNDSVKSDVSSVGKYDQYTILYSTNIVETTERVIDIFPLDTSEDWSIKRISEDTHLENQVISDQEINGWIEYIRGSFYGIEQVESIYYKADKEKVDVWIMIPDRNLPLLRKLIDVEMDVLDKFEAESDSLYIFEFHIIYRCGAKETSLTPSGAVPIMK